LCMLVGGRRRAVVAVLASIARRPYRILGAKAHTVYARDAALSALRGGKQDAILAAPNA
jgi:hypothetical protein